MGKTIEERIQELEKKVAALEVQVQKQQKNFIPEDSNGKCFDTKGCRNDI